jgi:hypothetical protein
VVRNLIAVVVGFVLAVGTVMGFDMVSHALYPPQAGLDLKDPAVLAGYVDALPLGAKGIVAAGWFFAPLLGALAAIMIGRESLPGWIVATIFLAAATFNVILIPHPQWMVVACFVLPGLAAILAQQLMSGRIES